MRRPIVLIAAFILGAAPALAAGPAIPAGAEFQVNTYTPDRQGFMSIAADAAGDFVLVWGSNLQDGSDFGVFGQRYGASGAPAGTEFQVNTYTPGNQGGDPGSIDVSSGADGGFVVVWSAPDGYSYGIFGRRYDNTGAPIGGEFQVSAYTSSAQINASVASAPNGDFIVGWADNARDGSSFGVFAHRFDGTGTSIGGDFQLNTYTILSQGEFSPHLAVDAGGNTIAVWTSDLQDGSSFSLFARRFDSSGAGLGTEFQVSTYTFAGQHFPSVAADADGDFVVAWISYQDGNGSSVQARRFDSGGAALGTEFQVNTYTPGIQYPFRKGVFADASGRFTIVWSDQALDGYAQGIFGRQFDSDGSPLGAQFQINTHTVGGQNVPVIAGGSSGDFVVAWQSYAQDGSHFGVFAQRFQAGSPATDTPTAMPTDTPTITPTATPIGACPATVDGGCTTGFAKGALLVKEDVAGKEKLIAKMVKGPALAQVDLGNPLSGGGTVYSLCLYDDAGNLAGGTAASIVIDRAGDNCGGSACWTAVGGDPPGGKGYKYLDTALAADGVLKVLYKGGGAGKSKLIVKGKGPDLPDGIPAALQTTAFATVQLRASDGICLSLAVDDVKKHSSGFFKAMFAAP